MVTVYPTILPITNHFVSLALIAIIPNITDANNIGIKYNLTLSRLSSIRLNNACVLASEERYVRARLLLKINSPAIHIQLKNNDRIENLNPFIFFYHPS